MSVSDTHKIDFLSTDGETIVLTISDHLEWDTTDTHQVILQEKINSYLAFIESGEIFESYPLAKDKESFRIQVVLKHLPDEDGIDFLKQVETILIDSGYEFYYYVHSPFFTQNK